MSEIHDLLTTGARNEENIPLYPCTALTSTVPDGCKSKSIPQQLPICFSNRMARRPGHNTRVSVHRIAHFPSLFHGVWDPQIVAELLKIIPLNPTSPVIHLPQSGRSEYGLFIHLPVVVMLPMNRTVRLIGHHSDDRMVE